jgi:hypothetical protein
VTALKSTETVALKFDETNGADDELSIETGAVPRIGAP